jgi:GTP-binding protein
MKFIDSTIIDVRAGKGGDGIVSFKSAKGAAKLGPDGGDGGRGGDIVLVGNRQLSTLNSLRYRRKYQAEDGVKGGTNACRGRCGEALEIPVPLGTIVFDSQTGAQVGEILKDGERLVVAQGGRHGLGNIHWLSPTHQAPWEFRPGVKGEEKELRLELKLLADVGLAGFPNAGKSTLLSVISAARPKIADYPFTTLVPNLGVLDFGQEYFGQGVVVADVPGLIEGASEGRGLGHAFLRHLERTSLVVYVVDPLDPEREALEALAILQEEMRRFSPELAAKPVMVVINKIDLMDDEALAKVRAGIEAEGFEVLAVSAAQGRGLQQLKYRLRELVLTSREGEEQRV